MFHRLNSQPSLIQFCRLSYTNAAGSLRQTRRKRSIPIGAKLKMMPDTQSLIAELDSNLSNASSARHSAALRRLTDLFVASAETYSDDHVAVFDEVIGYLVAKSERPALIELSARLAPVDSPPMNVINRLASNDDIEIAGPLLCTSGVLADEVLLDVAKAKGQRHLAAIASRATISNSVTDVLVDRCGPDIIRKMVANEGALFSDVGFVKLINKAKEDKSLAAAIANRSDLPAELQPFLSLALA